MSDYEEEFRLKRIEIRNHEGDQRLIMIEERVIKLESGEEVVADGQNHIFQMTDENRLDRFDIINPVDKSTTGQKMSYQDFFNMTYSIYTDMVKNRDL